jgi:hypothetical protein
MTYSSAAKKTRQGKRHAQYYKRGNKKRSILGFQIASIFCSTRLPRGNSPNPFCWLDGSFKERDMIQEKSILEFFLC